MYEPISHYGMIGNLRTVALISKNGSLDWCCLPHINGPSVFAALLDHRKGGRFAITLGDSESWQEYDTGTNVMHTWMHCKDGEAITTEFMPLWGDLNGKGRSQSVPEVHRMVECIRGKVDLDVEWSPRFDYARGLPEIRRTEVWTAASGGSVLTLSGFQEGEVRETPYGQSVKGTLPLEAGDRRAMICRWGDGTAQSEEYTWEMLRKTSRAWKAWTNIGMLARDPDWAAPWTHMLVRSELALKLMIHADTGAMVAAPTTSLPEVKGGSKNWDYRFTWIRDASLASQALLFLGHEREAVEFLEWLEKVSEPSPGQPWEPRIMYGCHGENVEADYLLRHLEGYAGSRPVRIGNTAVEQKQHEVYGELMNIGYALLRRGTELDRGTKAFLARCADKVCDIWDTPDSGIWESREEPKHYVYSKVMMWVALDRAFHMSEQFGLEGDVEKWRSTGDAIAQAVLEKGYDEYQGTFVEYFGSTKLDAANLRIPVMEFLPFSDYRVQGTIDRTMERLMVNDLVYRNEHVDEEGREGAFGICTFWLVIDLALSGRLAEAKRIYEGALRYAKNLDLLPEQIDPYTGEFLGNFPQAFTHIGLVNAALYIALGEARDIQVPPPIGTREHRQILGRMHLEGESGRSRGNAVVAPSKSRGP